MKFLLPLFLSGSAAFGAVYLSDSANTFLNSVAIQGAALSPLTNNITVTFRHTIGVSNNGGNYITRADSNFRLKNSGSHPQTFDFVYRDFLGASHQWRTTAESYGVKHGSMLTACTFNFGDGTSFKLYTNGIIQAGSWIAGSGNVLATNVNAQSSIGGNGLTAGPQIGYYSDFAVWHSILSQQQIDLIRKSKVKGIELQVSPSTLRMWQPLDGSPNGLPCAILKTNLFVDRSGHFVNFTDPGQGVTRVSGMAERVCSYQPNE